MEAWNTEYLQVPFWISTIRVPNLNHLTFLPIHHEDVQLAWRALQPTRKNRDSH
jgi:hypothetical protein